jgi:hypothetical protein
MPPTPKHTPTPWAQGLESTDAVFDAARVERVATCHRPSRFDADDWSVANAARIVQCVNACAGIDDPAATLAEVRTLLGVIMARDDGREVIDLGEPNVLDGMAAEDGLSAGMALSDRQCADLARLALARLGGGR